MSRLDELIQELCPDGVEYKAIKDIAWTGIGLATSVTKHKRNDGVVLIHNSDIRQNKITLKSFEFLDEDFVKKNENKIHRLHDIVTVHTGDVGTSAVIEQEFVGSIGFTTIITRIKDFSKVSPYYLCNYLNSQLFKSEVRKKSISERSNLNQKDYEVIQVPIPPLEIQIEIVRLLDKFTAKTAELQAELNKEYEARKKQYKYQKEKLLTQNNGATTYTISELCSVSAGGDAPKNAMSKEITKEYTIPIISNGVRENAIYGYTNKAKIYEPAVTLAARGTIGYAEYRDYPYVPIIRLLSLIPKNTQILDTKYLYHCLVDKEYTLPTTGIPQLTAPMVKKIEISLPKIEIQKEIVRILDKYNIFYRDLQDNLNNELESRQKQYEFYRDKLLTFKELNESEVN